MPGLPVGGHFTRIAIYVGIAATLAPSIIEPARERVLRETIRDLCDHGRLARIQSRC